jgi:hypothetical protein
MIAYDLDGVLTADILFEQHSFEQINNLRNSHFFPLFRPKAPFVIITGRPIEDAPLTERWLSFNGIIPCHLFHGNIDIEKAAEYKMEVLNSSVGIKVFVESCRKQAEFLQAKCVNTKVIHFETFILEALNEVRITL